MTLPRQVTAGRFYQIIRRTTQRQFLLRPDDEVTEAFAYCMADAQRRFPVDILHTMVEANHHHTDVYDRLGNYPKFMEHLHKLVAKCINAFRGRWENLWAAVEPSVVEMLDRETVLNKVAYAASNPVKDGLVDRAVQWGGLNGYRALVNNRSIRARRPRFFFREDGEMPHELTLEFVIPPELGERNVVVAEIVERVEEIERGTRLERTRAGMRVMGMRTIREQSWRASPESVEPRRNLRPRFAGPRHLQVAAMRAFREFVSAYRLARERWQTGKLFEFPLGTYRLSHLVAPAPSAI